VASYSALPIHEFPTMANGAWMLQQIVIDQPLCPFQMVTQCDVIRGAADCALFLNFVPFGVPKNNTRVLIIDFGLDECFKIIFDFSP